MKADRASSTALLIARSIVLADVMQTLRPMLVPGSAELSRRLLAAAERAWWFDAALRHSWMQAAIFAVERMVLPGAVLHWLARKRLLDAMAQDAIAAGCRQLVVFGAGLDTLAWRVRLAHPACFCFELDHPATQSIKRRAFDREPAGSVPALAALDLNGEPVGAALKALPGFDMRVPTLFVAEGLLMYLSAACVNDLMRAVAASGAPGSRFAFTFMEARPGEALGFQNGRRTVNRWLRWRGEPFQWGLDREVVADFAMHAGFDLESLSTPEELRRRFLAPVRLERAPLAVGESVALFAHRR